MKSQIDCSEYVAYVTYSVRKQISGMTTSLSYSQKCSVTIKPYQRQNFLR